MESLKKKTENLSQRFFESQSQSQCDIWWFNVQIKTACWTEERTIDLQLQILHNRVVSNVFF